MGFIQSLKNLFTVHNSSINGDMYSFMTGRSEADNWIDQESAMQITAVYACVNVLAQALAQLPLYLYKIGDNEERIKAFDSPIYSMLHDEPNEEMTSFDFRMAMMSNLLLWGNAYAQIRRNGKGEVAMLTPLMSERMRVKRYPGTKKLYYEYQFADGDSENPKDLLKQFKPSEILHIPALSFDGIKGYSPIGVARNTLGISKACDEYSSRFFANDATPSIVLEHPGTLGEEAAKRLKKSWNAKFRGSKNAGKTAILEEGLKVSQLSIPAKDAQFLETRQFQVEEIARLFKVPLHMINSLEHATFSNIEQQSLEFVIYTLDPWVKKWEQCLTRALIPKEDRSKYEIKFNVDGLLRGDYESRMRGYSTAIQNGFMSPNDVRTLEHMELIPDEKGGNKYMVNGSMTPLEDAGAAYDSRNNAATSNTSKKQAKEKKGG